MTPRELLFKMKHADGTRLRDLQKIYEKMAEPVPRQLRTFLDLQFMDLMTEEQIAEKTCYSERHVQRILKAGKEMMNA